MEKTKKGVFTLFKSLNGFDNITKFRLINSFLAAVVMGIMLPITIHLKGMYMLPYIIGLFSIATLLSVKTNRFMVENFNLNILFKMGIIVNTLIFLLALLFFYDEVITAYILSILGIFEVIVFSAYSIRLNNYITKYTPNKIQEFQITKNNISANGSILGSVLITVTTYFSNITCGVIVLSVVSFLVSLWLIINWNFFNGVED